MTDNTKSQIKWAAITFAIYSIIFSWKIAILVMVTIGFHECSHLLAARKRGMKTKGFFFIPFVGGAALIQGPYRKLSDKAIVLLAGPIGGGLLAGVTALAWCITGIPVLAVAAYWMAIMNLFNLFPLSFLDGGQLLGSITNSINRTLGLVCLVISTVIGAGLLLKFAPIIGILIVIIGGQSVWKEYNNWKNLREGKEYLVTEDYLHPPIKMTSNQMSLTAGAWLLAAGLLCLLIHAIPYSSLGDLLSQ